jgi:hypothetical protein
MILLGRQTHNHYATLTNLVESWGLEPQSLPCESSVFPLDDDPEIGGSKGDRTLDLRTASATLSQLSYAPVMESLSVTPSSISGRLQAPKWLFGDVTGTLVGTEGFEPPTFCV